MLTELETLVLDYAEAKRVFSERAKALFKTAISEIFEKHPCLDSFSWTQYAPYFNDGEPCEFHVHADEPDVTVKLDNVLVHFECTSVRNSVWDDDLRKYKNTDKPTFCFDSWDDVNYETDSTNSVVFNVDEACAKHNEQLVALRNDIEIITDFLMSAEDFARDAFTEDGIVIVRKDSIEIEDYDHS